VNERRIENRSSSEEVEEDSCGATCRICGSGRLGVLEKGYEAATVADITRRAGSSHGTFYVYFDSKEDIFDAVAQERVMVAFNAALNGSSLEDANRMEDRNQSLIIANAITEGAKELG